ncbi:hypothetical protein [Arthrobacter koreensis]|uniref:hypothetical protein n=1 Tax=Arthrobacter koreensis TaxID=199136 RepID=UPI002DB80D74|nr:hypothetical protein [Arthrobacter koreensis]MEB7503576.1 hypothetical protein [Arthrobacter koreensis]
MLDISGLQNWVDAEATQTGAEALRTAGEAFRDAVQNQETAWDGLSGCYDAPEREDILGVFRNVTPHSELVESASAQAASALTDFADQVAALNILRRDLLARVAAFGPPACTPEDPDGSLQDFQRLVLQTEIDRLARSYQEAEETCAAALKNVSGHKPGLAGFLAGPNFGLVAAAADNIMGVHTFRRVTVETIREVPMPALERRFTPLLGSFDRLTGPEQLGHRWLWEDGRWISVHSPLHPDAGITRRQRFTEEIYRTVREWRPEVNRSMYNRSEWYRTRVDARPDRWHVPDPQTPGWAETPNSLKGIKVGGAVLTTAMAGFTFMDNRAENHNQLLQDNPEMSDTERDFRASEMAAVQTGTSVVIDVGAGVAGAAVGTMIGGPLGTVIGFGVGMGISWLTDAGSDGNSVKDRVSDVALDFYDKAKDGVSAGLEAAGDAWDRLWGK